MNNVAAIVVTYNRKAMLEQCVAHLLAQSHACDVLVVDNASSDGTGEMMAQIVGENARVHYVNTGRNLGGAGGFNFGLKHAVRAGYSHLWIMDDDSMADETALEELMRADALLDGDYGFLSSVVLWKDGRECRMNRQKICKRFFEHVELLPERLLAIEQATFVSCFFRADTVRRVGLPITEFFIWGDDIEYTRRMSVRMKLPCYLAGGSVVRHHMASNDGSDISTDSVERIARYRYAYRNENYLYRKEGLKGVCYYVARCGLHLVRIWTRAKDHRLRRSRVLIGAAVSGLFFNPKVERI